MFRHIIIFLSLIPLFGCRKSHAEGTASDTVPLPPLYKDIVTWGIDAPDDSDQTVFLSSGNQFGGTNGTSGYLEKHYNRTINQLSELPSITLGGMTRFAPVITEGIPAIQHSIRQGDALRWQGNRSGIVYGGFPIHHGHDYWFAWAFKLGNEWQVMDGGGHSDRVGLLDTHQEEASVGTPSGLCWFGDSPPGHELWWFVQRYDGSGDAYLYNAPAAPGQWQRVILHYRSGSAEQKPVYDIWFATGTDSYKKLEKVNDPYAGKTWTITPAFGDPLTNTLNQSDYIKLELYKWTTQFYGNIPGRTMWSSGVFGKEGPDLYQNAVAALQPYTR